MGDYVHQAADPVAAATPAAMPMTAPTWRLRRLPAGMAHDVARAGTVALAHTDLKGAFGDTDQHDVHHPHPAVTRAIALMSRPAAPTMPAIRSKVSCSESFE
jgi:hypothetical protein